MVSCPVFIRPLPASLHPRISCSRLLLSKRTCFESLLSGLALLTILWMPRPKFKEGKKFAHGHREALCFPGQGSKRVVGSKPQVAPLQMGRCGGPAPLAWKWGRRRRFLRHNQKYTQSIFLHTPSLSKPPFVQL